MEGRVFHSAETQGCKDSLMAQKLKRISSHLIFLLLKYEKKQHNIFKSIIQLCSWFNTVSIPDFVIKNRIQMKWIWQKKCKIIAEWSPCCVLPPLGSYHSALYSRHQSSFGDAPLWKMEQLSPHLILCYQEIRKWRWGSLEKTLLLWASVAEL